MFKKQSSTLFYRATSRDKQPRASTLGFAGRSSKESAAHRIGIWDIDVNAGFLFKVLDLLNRRQRLFKFHRIEATVPMGLTLAGERTREIAKSYGGNPRDPDIAKNTFAGDILKIARPMRKSLNIGLLVCVVAPMIMDTLTLAEDGREGVGWNFFSTSYRDVAIVSAYELRTYAPEAKRPFEAALAGIVVGAVLAAVFKKVSFHDDTRGCIMDYCDNRSDIVEMLRKFDLCEETLTQIPESARSAVHKMLDALKEYQR
jgi:hypothetical protein